MLGGWDKLQFLNRVIGESFIEKWHLSQELKEMREPVVQIFQAEGTANA